MQWILFSLWLGFALSYTLQNGAHRSALVDTSPVGQGCPNGYIATPQTAPSKRDPKFCANQPTSACYLCVRQAAQGTDTRAKFDVSVILACGSSSYPQEYISWSEPAGASVSYSWLPSNLGTNWTVLVQPTGFTVTDPIVLQNEWCIKNQVGYNGYVSSVVSIPYPKFPEPDIPQSCPQGYVKLPTLPAPSTRDPSFCSGKGTSICDVCVLQSENVDYIQAELAASIILACPLQSWPQIYVSYPAEGDGLSIDYTWLPKNVGVDWKLTLLNDGSSPQDHAPLVVKNEWCITDGKYSGYVSGLASFDYPVFPAIIVDP
jgi:hypothetical protein